MSLQAITAIACGFIAVIGLLGYAAGWWSRGRRMNRASAIQTPPPPSLPIPPAAMAETTAHPDAGGRSSAALHRKPVQSQRPHTPLPPPPRQPQSLKPLRPSPATAPVQSAEETLQACAPGKMRTLPASPEIPSTATSPPELTDEELDAMEPDLPPPPRKTRVRLRSPKKADFRQL